MRRAGATEWRYFWGHTILVNHETHPHHLWFFRPRLFCPSVKQKSYQTALQRCPGTVGVSHVSVKQRMFTVSNVPLETYPGSKMVHLILQGLDISEQEYSVEEDCEPFPSVCCVFQRVSRDVSFVSCGFSGGHCSTRCSEVSPMATLGPWIKCPESG